MTLSLCWYRTEYQPRLWMVTLQRNCAAAFKPPLTHPWSKLIPHERLPITAERSHVTHKSIPRLAKDASGSII